MSKGGRKPGAFIVTVAALSRIVVRFRCMTRSAVIQSDMVKIVIKPAIRIRMTGAARTQIMFSRAGMAIFAIGIACVVEYQYFPIFDVCVAANTGAFRVMIFRFF